MIDLTPFFSPIDESIHGDLQSDSSFESNIKIFRKVIPNYEDAHIAIIGVNDMRGIDHHSCQSHSPNEIRKKLYSLESGSDSYQIIDLGNLIVGSDLSESYKYLTEVCKILINSNVLPVILGGSQDLDCAQYYSYEKLSKYVSIVNVDAFLDLENINTNSLDRNHLNKIFDLDPNCLVSYSHVAYQSYLVNPEHIYVLNKLYFEAFRLGEIRNNLSEVEPSIRQADMLTFDLCAIRSSDAPASIRAQPFGLSSEDACQICWFAGISEKLSSFGIYGYCADADDDNKKTASVIATMVWYFIEGFYNRKHETDFISSDITKFIVDVEPESLVFYKSKLSNRWWIEIPFANKSTYSRNCIMPCNYSDYQDATIGNIPDRYINALKRG